MADSSSSSFRSDSACKLSETFSETNSYVSSVKASKKAEKMWIRNIENQRTNDRLPWHQIKVSSFPESKIADLRTKAGMSESFEILVPSLLDVASRPPEGFHTFFLDQVVKGLRFPIPLFILELCDYFRISPSQLAPNSYSYLLAMGTLIKFFRFPLSLPLLIGLTKISKKDPAKFVFSSRAKIDFLRDNPPPRKRWMSKYFFVKYHGESEEVWRCSMDWVENFQPRAPFHPVIGSYSLENFLSILDRRCYLVPELIKDDILCYFGFCSKGLQVKGDIAERMKKSLLLEAKKKRKANSANVPSSPKVTEQEDSSFQPEHTMKHKVSESEQTDAAHTEARDPPPEHSYEKPSGLILERTDEKMPSFVSKPLGDVSLGFIRQLPNKEDKETLKSISTLKILENMALGVGQTLAFSGEAANRLIEAHEIITSSKGALRDTQSRLEEVMKENADLKEKYFSTLESLKKTESSLESQTQRVEKYQSAYDEFEQVVERYYVKKEDFLKSEEFDALCADKALSYFDLGFSGCVTQLRANGFPEDTYPFEFLDSDKALENLPDDDESTTHVTKANGGETFKASNLDPEG